MCIYGDRAEKNDQLHLSAFEAGAPQLAWIGESNLIEHTLDQASRFQNKLERIADVVEKIKVDAIDRMPQKFVVNRAVKAEKSSYPVVWFIVFVSTVSYTYLSYLFLSFLPLPLLRAPYVGVKL